MSACAHVWHQKVHGLCVCVHGLSRRVCCEPARRFCHPRATVHDGHSCGMEVTHAAHAPASAVSAAAMRSAMSHTHTHTTHTHATGHKHTAHAPASAFSAAAMRCAVTSMIEASIAASTDPMSPFSANVASFSVSARAFAARSLRSAATDFSWGCVPCVPCVCVCAVCVCVCVCARARARVPCVCRNPKPRPCQTPTP